MKASELRIGNYFIGYSNYLQQWELTSFGLLIDGIEVDEIIKGFVPLTEDWLEKFGLKKNNGYPHKLLNGFIKIRNGVYFYKYNLLEIELQYVHQLQNLYFALTNEELTIKKQ